MKMKKVFFKSLKNKTFLMEALNNINKIWVKDIKTREAIDI